MLRKHSVTINGHGTSYSIEDEFHAELARLAAVEGKPLARLIASIDAARQPGTNLSSAIRLHVLEALRSGR
jgi:predicted DNA-binding ribbon-helix-helix protein